MEVLPMTAEFVVGEQYDRAKEVKEFDETKAGVKGLVDSGMVKKIPRIFIHPPENLQQQKTSSSSINGDDDHSTGSNINGDFQVPVIDLKGVEGDQQRSAIVEKIREASQTWGFFQMVNHGVPISVMNGMLQGVKQFHEQSREVKMELYSRDPKRTVRFYCNGDLHLSQAAGWRDSLACNFPDDTLYPQALPLLCRNEIVEYMKCMIKLRDTVSELLSEALGLSRDYLSSVECLKSESLLCHYYPVCPEPDLTLGIPKHSDPSFLTLLQQDHIGGLQILHQNRWVDVTPMEGALVANLGDFMQIITNDKFKSVEHRVLAKSVGPRLSAACFFNPSTKNMSTAYGPIKELLSDKNPPKFQEVLVPEYQAYYLSNARDGTSALPHFML